MKGEPGYPREHLAGLRPEMRRPAERCTESRFVNDANVRADVDSFIDVPSRVLTINSILIITSIYAKCLTHDAISGTLHRDGAAGGEHAQNEHRGARGAVEARNLLGVSLEGSVG
jgi:hypothetical protein